MLERTKVLEFTRNAIDEKSFSYYSTEYMRLSTMYWSANILRMLHFEKDLGEIKVPILNFLCSCRNTDGGYGMSKGFPSTMLSTFTALQILYIFNELKYDERVEDYILGLFNTEGFFSGDVFGEEDTRFSCCGILAFKLLALAKDSELSGADLSKEIPESYISSIEQKGFCRNKAIEYILRCYNFDGGFGSSPGCESHTAQIFCCLGALRSLGALDSFDKEKTTQFLVFRQNACGGFSGRPCKKEDVCYSFWNLASLAMLDEFEVFDQDMLRSFVFSCQDTTGGFSDRPENTPDLYHTMFALAGLSLLKQDGLKMLDSGFCL